MSRSGCTYPESHCCSICNLQLLNCNKYYPQPLFPTMPEPQTVSTEILRTLHRIHRQLSDLNERLDRCPKRVGRPRPTWPTANRCWPSKERGKRLSHGFGSKATATENVRRQGQGTQIKLNTAQSNREYQTLLEQIQAAEMANSVLADEILEAMDKVDEHKKKVAQGESDLAAARQKQEKIRVEVSEQEPLASRRYRPIGSGIKTVRSRPARRGPRALPARGASSGRRRPGPGGKPMLRRLQSADTAEPVQQDHDEPAGFLQKLRPDAVHDRCQHVAASGRIKQVQGFNAEDRVRFSYANYNVIQYVKPE